MEKQRINELLSQNILTKNQCREVLNSTLKTYITGKYGCFCSSTERQKLTNEFHKIVNDNNLND
jgi:hypothetical protein